MKNLFIELWLFLKKLTKLTQPVPPEYKEQFEQYLLKNSVSRLQILAVLLLCNYVILNTVFLIFFRDRFDKLFDALLNRNGIFLLAKLGYFAVPVLFLVFSRFHSKAKANTSLWLWCYLFVIVFVINSLVTIFFSDNAVEISGYFTFTFFVALFVPDFKQRFMPFLIFYILTAWMVSRLSMPYLIEFQIILFMTGIAISVVKISHYNGAVKVFVEALRMKELNKKLESLSVIDELTKINNRRAFMKYFEIIWKQSLRLKLPVNVLMIDIDYFKKYNDSLGHLEGDKALVAVAQCLKKKMKRETDFVARFGGEEFVCLLSYINKEDAEVFSKKLVQSIENMKIPHPKSEHSPYLTISAGMASSIPNEDNTSKQILDEADKALYEAKQSGRNRVTIK